MLLVLTLVYLFHGLQSRAAPLASIHGESLASSNSTILSTPACICPADQRTIWDILWSCLATIFACSWVSIHPNIPAPNESSRRIFLRRLELMFWAVVSPEMIITWALRQWFGARNLEKLYKGGQMYPIYLQILNLGILTLERGWAGAHGHFIQMGGFMLFEGEIAKGVLSPKEFSELLAAGKIEFPTVTVEEIEDRSKVDGFSKTIALGQTLWFVAQCIARRSQHLDLTLVELLTLSLAILNGLMYFLWWNKPLDVRCPVRVYLLDKSYTPNMSDKTLSQMDRFVHWLQDVFILVITEGRRQITTLESLPVLIQVLLLILATIMIPFVLALTFFILLTLVLAISGIVMCIRWIAMFITEDSDIGVGDTKVPTFYASESARPSRDRVAFFICMPIVGVVFGGIHCVGWFFNFPSSAEAMLWRVSSAVLTGIAFLFPIFLIFVRFLLQFINRRQYFIIAVSTMMLLVYVVSRLLLLVEAFISLRYLTPGMLTIVKWTSFIPHI